VGIFQRLGKSTDAFFSYARDDDKTYSGYIQNFHQDLQQVLAGMVRQREDTLRDSIDCHADPNFFIDRQGLPLNGEFGQELRDAVETSAFLFIFIGMRYPQSEWCGEELKCFVKALSNDRAAALKRTFVIVLESEAEDKDWGDFLEKPERAQFVPFYSSHGRPIPRFLEHDGQFAVRNPRYDNRLIDICKTLLDRTPEIRKPQSGHLRGPASLRGMHDGPRPLFEPPPAAARVTIGVTTKDLRTWCRELAETLQARHTVVQLEPDDFYNAEAETFAAEHSGPRSLFIQPYSRAKVIRMPDQPGGHLYRLQSLLDGYCDQRNLLWWRVDASEVVPAAMEDDPRHLRFLDALDAKAGAGPLEALAARVDECLHPRVSQPILLPPTIYIESSKDDGAVTRLLEAKLKELWRKSPFSELGDLLCIHVPWEQLHNEGARAIENGHGVIFVYGHKTFRTLADQIQNFERLAFSMKREFGRAVAVTPPHPWQGPVGYAYSFYCAPPHGGPRDDRIVLTEEDTANQLLQHIQQIYRSVMEQPSAA
jgi:hypothetical protein